jgi:hypothetical protein
MWIDVPKGPQTLVDDDIVEQLRGWMLFYNSRTGYVHLYRGREVWSLHRWIVRPEKGQYTDHINGNKLDNRCDNLRVCNHSQSMANVGPRKGNTSGYKGVSWAKKERKWYATITVNKKQRNLGLYDDPQDAARAYNAAALEAWGEYARLNDV